MNKKLRYICIFLILPIVMAVVFIVSLYFEDKKKGDEEATTAASKVYSDEEINAMLLAEYQKSQSTREFQEITTETVELTPEDNEYDDMIDETDAEDVKGEVVGEDDLSDEDEAVIAEAEKQSAILRAEAAKEKMIREAEGQAEAILKVQKATADGIRMIREAGADEAVLKLKSLEAFERAAQGQANKIIIPSEIAGIAGLAAGVKSVLDNGK